MSPEECVPTAGCEVAAVELLCRLVEESAEPTDREQVLATALDEPSEVVHAALYLLQLPEMAEAETPLEVVGVWWDTARRRKRIKVGAQLHRVADLFPAGGAVLDLAHGGRASFEYGDKSAEVIAHQGREETSVRVYAPHVVSAVQSITEDDEIRQRTRGYR